MPGAGVHGQHARRGHQLAAGQRAECGEVPPRGRYPATQGPGGSTTRPAQVFTGNTRGAVTNWQLDSEQNVEVYRPAGEQRVHRGVVTALAFAPDLGALISAGEDGTVRLQWTSSRSGFRH